MRVLRLLLLLVLSAIALAVVIPTLGSTADVVAVCVIAAVVIGFVIFIWTQGGSGFRGGWNNRGRMG